MVTASHGQFSAAVPPLSEQRALAWPPRTHATLASGLEVVLAQSHTIPKFTGQLFFRSGDAAAAQIVPGLASITAAVVRTGTALRSSQQIEEDLRRMGADLSSHAGADTSAVSFAGLTEFSAEILRLVAEMSRQAAFPAGEFERERRQMVEGLRIERTTPGFLASERLRNVLFGAHPYGTISPTEEQAEAYRLEQLKQFYSQNYRPGSALLLMVGDFAPKTVLEQIERAFGAWPAGSGLAASDPALPVLHGRRVRLVHLPGAVQTQILVGNRAITRKHPDWLALTLANSIYGGAFNSRLVMNIREQKGYTYSPRSAAHPLRQHGYFSVHAAVRNEVVAATLTEMFYEMDRMRSMAVGDEELADARNYLSGVFSLGLATQDGLAGQLATAALDRLPEDYLETYRERIQALTANEVLSAARKYFDSANAQIIAVGDRAQIEHQMALFGPVEVCDAHGQLI